MSEQQGFFFQGDGPADDVTADAGRRNAIVIVGAIAGAVLVVLLLVVFVFGGDDDEGTAPAPRASRSPQVTTATPTPGPIPSGAPIATGSPQPGALSLRDPFHELAVEDTGTAGGGGALPIPTSGSTGGVGGTGSPAPTSPRSLVIGGHRVTLLDIFENDGDTYAQTRVDDTIYTPGVGETFAQNFELVSVTDTCASYLFGDESFELCGG